MRKGIHGLFETGSERLGNRRSDGASYRKKSGTKDFAATTILSSTLSPARRTGAGLSLLPIAETGAGIAMPSTRLRSGLDAGSAAASGLPDTLAAGGAGAAAVGGAAGADGATIGDAADAVGGVNRAKLRGRFQTLRFDTGVGSGRLSTGLAALSWLGVTAACSSAIRCATSSGAIGPSPASVCRAPPLGVANDRG